MTIDELLDHYRYKLALPNLTKRSRTVAEATYKRLVKLRAIYDEIMRENSDEETFKRIYKIACDVED